MAYDDDDYPTDDYYEDYGPDYDEGDGWGDYDDMPDGWEELMYEGWEVYDIDVHVGYED